MDNMNTRLRQARVKAGFVSARSAALRFGWKVSTYAAHENGQNAAGFDAVNEYADAFDVDVLWLIFGNQEIKRRVRRPYIGILGDVGPSGTVAFREPNNPSDIELRELFIDFDVDCFAFKVTGNGLWPRYDDGDLIIAAAVTVDRVRIGEEIIIKHEGQFLLRQVVHFREENTYELAIFNAPERLTTSVSFAWYVVAIVPSEPWMTIYSHEPRHKRLSQKVWDQLTAVRERYPI